MVLSAIEERQVIYRKYDAATRRWWFFVGVLLLQLLPPFTSKNFDFNEMYEIISTTLHSAFFFSCGNVYPVFQGIAISVIVSLMLFRNKARFVFGIHASISYLLFATVQLTAITPRYGLSIISSGAIMHGLLATVWFWEAFAGFNDFAVHKQPAWKYTVIAPAIIAFGMPLDLSSLSPDFDLSNFSTSGSALTFCMMTPVFLAVLIFFYPKVNIVVLRMTSLVGTIIALYNVPTLFRFDVIGLGLIHLPLLFLSVLGLILSMRRQCTPRTKEGN